MALGLQSHLLTDTWRHHSQLLGSVERDRRGVCVRFSFFPPMRSLSRLTPNGPVLDGGGLLFYISSSLESTYVE